MPNCNFDSYHSSPSHYAGHSFISCGLMCMFSCERNSQKWLHHLWCPFPRDLHSLFSSVTFINSCSFLNTFIYDYLLLDCAVLLITLLQACHKLPLLFSLSLSYFHTNQLITVIWRTHRLPPINIDKSRSAALGGRAWTGRPLGISKSHRPHGSYGRPHAHT